VRRGCLTECKTSQCKAACCGVVPVKNNIVRLFKDLINKNSKIIRNGDVSMVFNEETLVCGFLDENYRCKIYDNRPDVCRKFGSKEEIVNVKLKGLLND
jgi:Fe-S-cluster containining protein